MAREVSSSVKLCQVICEGVFWSAYREKGDCTRVYIRVQVCRRQSSHDTFISEKEGEVCQDFHDCLAWMSPEFHNVCSEERLDNSLFCLREEYFKYV